MSEFLCDLANNLSEDKTRFKQTMKIFSKSSLDLVTRKGIDVAPRPLLRGRQLSDVTRGVLE
jgi:hypothetical protein